MKARGQWTIFVDQIEGIGWEQSHFYAELLAVVPFGCMEVMRPQINEAIKLKSDVKFDLQYHLKAVKAVAVRRRDGLSVQFSPLSNF